MADEQVAPPAVPESGRKKLRILLIAAVVLAGAGGAFFFLTRPQRAHASPEDNRGAPKAILHLDEFVVNLADENDRAFLRVGIQLGLSQALRTGSESKSLDLVPPIRDAILGALTQYKADELLTTQGKAALKQAIITAVSQRLPELGVQDVYFTEFLVQR